MIKKLTRLLILPLLFISLLIVACVHETFKGSSKNAGVEFSVDEAKSVFEETYTNKILTRGHSHDCGVECDHDHSRNIISPRDYTPRWDRSTRVVNKYVTGYDVPIITEKTILAYFPPTENKAYEELVEATQKVIVAKSNENEDVILSYIATSIPTPEFFYDKNYKAFSHLDAKARFSGVVVISDLNNAVLSVTNYYRGEITEHIDMRDESIEPFERVEIANRLLSSFVLIEYRYQRIQTRATETGGGGSGSPNIYCGNCRKYHPSNQICEILMTACPICHGLNTCHCCIWCGDYPCSCSYNNYCEVCGRLLSNCPGHPVNYCSICQLPLDQCPKHGIGPVDPPLPPVDPPPCTTQTTYNRNSVDAKLTRIKQATEDYKFEKTFGTFDDFKNAVAQRPEIEHAATLRNYTDYDLGHLFTTPYTDDKGGQVGLRVDNHTVASIHNHTPEAIQVPSPQDLYTLAAASAEHPNYTTSIVYDPDGISYAIHIANPVLLARFFQAYQTQFDHETGNFVQGSELYNYFYNLHPLQSDRNLLYADRTAALLAHFNTGVVLMKLDLDGPQTNVSQYVVKKHLLNDSLVFTECKD